MENNHIAVIGMAGVFPDANDIDSFYQNLRNGKDSVREISLGRIIHSGIPYDRNYRRLAFLDRVDFFDYKFFEISRREAELMEPAQRILLEKTWEAIANAGYTPEQLSRNTGIFLGGDPYSDYPSLVSDYDATIYSGNLHSMLSGRISYQLNFTGPSITIDTACSSSLVAIHEACAKLKQREIDYAIAGGVCIITFPPEFKEGETDLGINSPDGKSKTFDASADGTGGGEGGGVVLLKRLSDALTSGDNILAVIRGSAVNHGGNRSNGITAPSPAAQTELLIKAWQNAEIDPEQITFFEAHGTGTKLGDPIEFKGISDAFSHFTAKKKFCAMSAVKTNIGHLNNAAGIAGLIKCILSLRESVLFPSLHFNEPNPLIDFHNTAVHVNTELRNWEPGMSKICGLSSFGISGTNCHVVLEEPPSNVNKRTSLTGQRLFLKLSARSVNALQGYVDDVRNFLKSSQQPLDDVIFTLNSGRNDHEYRTGFSFIDKQELIKSLDQWLISRTEFSQVDKTSEIVLLLSGSPLSSSIAEELYTTSRVYREHRDSVSRSLTILDKTDADLISNQVALVAFLNSTGFNIRTLVATGIGKVAKRIIHDQMEPDQIAYYVDEIRRAPDNLDENKLKEFVTKSSGDCVFIEIASDCMLSKFLKGWSGRPKELKIISLDICDATGSHGLNFEDLYKSGVLIDWDSYYTDDTFNRVSAPYPKFEKTKCWAAPKSMPIRNGNAQLCYEAGWKETTVGIGYKDFRNRKAILFSDSGEKMNALGNILESNGNTITHIAIDREECSDYAQVNKKIYNREDLPGVIFYYYEESGNMPLRSSLVVLDHLFIILRSFSEEIAQGKLSFVLITHTDPQNNPGSKGRSPIAYALQAMVASTLSDSPLADIHSIDFLGHVDHISFARAIYNELLIDEEIRFVLYQNGARLVRSFQKMIPVTPTENWVKENATILVTGGASGVGFELCRYIAQVEKVHLIILGRTATPSPSLSVLKAAGCEVTYLDVDVSDSEALNGQFKKLTCRKIDVVFHAAGLPGVDMPLISKDLDIFHHTLGPKVQGTLNLLECVDKYSPDVVVFFSSLNASMPRKNSIEYAAANAFLDGLAATKISTSRIVSINWPGFKEVGMGVGKHFDKEGRSGQLSNIDFVELLNYILVSQKSNVAVSGFNLDRLTSNPFFVITTNGIREESINETNNLQEQPATQKRSSSVVEKITAIWCDVLKCEDANATDDFFEVGGHSLNGARLINLVESAFGVKMEMEDLYDYSTIEKLTEYIQTRQGPVPNAFQPIPVLPDRPFYDLSHAQKRIWVDAQLDENSTTYFMKKCFRIADNVNPKSLERALQTIVERHESLRTCFISVDDQVKQKILSVGETSFKIRYEEVDSDTDMSLQEILSDEVFFPFDLTKAPLFRVKLTRFKDGHHLLLFNMHHIISDGWSTDVIRFELSTLYKSLEATGGLAVLPPLPIQYRDFAGWQTQQLNDPEERSRHQRFWKEKFEGFKQPFSPVTDYERPLVKTYNGARVLFEISHEESAQLLMIGKESNVTFFMLMLACTSTLMYHETKQTDIVLGTPVSGRSHHDLEILIGVFVNTLPLRLQVNPSMNFCDFVEYVKNVSLEAFKHEDYPFDEILKDLQLPRDISRSPLFDVFLETQDMIYNEEDRLLDMETVSTDAGGESSKYDLSFAFVNINGKIKGSIEYNTDLYAQERIEILSVLFKMLVSKIVENKILSIETLVATKPSGNNIFASLNI